MPTKTTSAPPHESTLLKIQDVAAETGLTSRAIRYYEEVGLLEPAARSGGAYRLYDASDLERLRTIKELRDDAGFSLAQIGQLLEDEAARERNRERFRADAGPRGTSRDPRGCPEPRRAADRDPRIEGRARLGAMIEAARARRAHLDGHLAELDGGPAPHPDRNARA